MQEQELFRGYEVKNWEFSPRIYKILAFSAIFNVLALLVVAQSNLLTTKGCDSPLVGGVCQVLDTLVVGGSVLATDSEYVNEPYEKTELPSADEIVWVPVQSDPFNYPEGYFALSNPESIQTPMEIPTDPNAPFPNIPGIPNPTTGAGTTDLMNQPQVLPPSNDNAISGKLPDSPFTFDGPNPTIPRGKTSRVKTPKPQKNNQALSNKSPDELPNFEKDPQTAEKDPNKEVKNPTVENNAEPKINKKVMKDYAAFVRDKYDKKEVDLTKNFKVVAEGVLTKDGKLDITPDKKTKQPRSRILATEGDPQMVDVVGKAIAAIGDSGWLVYLRDQGVEKINFTVVQDNDNLQVIITSDMLTPERANTVTSGLGGVISGALMLDKNGFKKLGDDEKLLLSNAKVAVNPQNNKQFVLNFVLPKPIAQELITRKLKEPLTEEVKPQSTAQIKENNQTSAK